MATLVASYHLMIRALRESRRQPGVEIQNIFIPLFFLFVTVGAIGCLTASGMQRVTVRCSRTGNWRQS